MVEESAGTLHRQLDQLPRGTVIENRYEVEAFAGQGGMGVVYKVRDRRNSDVLALKMLRPDKVTDDIMRQLSQSEARTGLYLYRKGVVHGNIAATYDMGFWSPAGGKAVPYFVMQFVEGPSLQKLLDEEKQKSSLLPPDRVLCYLSGVASGVAAAHEAGLVHRDLKPGNVLIEAATDTARVTDFGISVLQGASTRERKAVQEFSTSLWAAPEQKADDHTAPESFATDVNALGKILYYALSGRYYEPEDYAPVGGRRHLPHSADDLIRKACRLNPDGRHPDAGSFLQDLKDVHNQYLKLLAESREDSPLASPEVIRDKKAEYRALERMHAPWDPRMPLLEELAAVAPRDPEVAKWMEVYNAYRRERLQEGLEQALREADPKTFSALLHEGVNLLAAAEVLDWRLRFASAQAGDQAGARAYRAAQDLLRPFLTEGLPPERLRELHQKVEDWGRLADRADHAEALRLSYEHDRARLSLGEREARLQALSMVAPELPELEAYRRELKEEQEAAARQAEERAQAERKAHVEVLASEHDALPPGRGILKRRSLRDELARLDGADPRLEAWGKEIADIEEAETIKVQLRGLAVTHETRQAYAGKIEDLRLLTPQDQDLPSFTRLLEAFDRAEEAANAAAETRRRGIADLLEDYEALGPDASAAARQRLLARLEGLDPNHQRLAVWKKEIKEAKARQEKKEAEEAEATAPPVPDKPEQSKETRQEPSVSPLERTAQATGKELRAKSRNRPALSALLILVILTVLGILAYRLLPQSGSRPAPPPQVAAPVQQAPNPSPPPPKPAPVNTPAVQPAQANSNVATAQDQALGYQDGPEARQGKAQAEAALAQEDQARQAAQRAEEEKTKAQGSHRAGDTWVNPKDGLMYVYIPPGPPGSFMMGAVSGDSDAYGDEKPRHSVTISQGFWMAKTEVTVGAYKRFCSATGWSMPSAPSFNANWQSKDHPIVNVDWNDAEAYCEWAGGRLPTEAEWEYAARAGTDRVYYWGNTMDGTKAWYYGNSGNQTHPVGQKGANGFGLYDMTGNVWEWCSDWYGDSYYGSSPGTDPTGPGSGKSRVLRGGSWLDFPIPLRASRRDGDTPAHRVGTYGFRSVVPTR